MAFKTILLEKENGISILTLNRPDRLNALNEVVFEELGQALDIVDKDDETRVLVFTGAGKAFCASADVKADEGGEQVLAQGMPPTEIIKVSKYGAQVVTRFLTGMRKPTVAMVNGLAIGDGFDWVLSCDIRIGSENAKFMNAFVNMGLLPVTGGTWLLPRTVGPGKALEILMTGRWVYAEEAERIGILNKVVPAAELREQTMALAAKLASMPPVSLNMMKRIVYKSLEVNLDAGLELAVQAEALLTTTKDHKEAYAAFQQKRKPVFIGQ